MSDGDLVWTLHPEQGSGAWAVQALFPMTNPSVGDGTLWITTYYAVFDLA